MTTGRALLVFISIFVVGVLGFELPRWGGTLSLTILPSGIAVGALYRWGRRLWPAVFAAGAAIDSWVHSPILAALGVGIGLSAGAWLTVWILEQRDFDPSFGHARDVPLFIWAALLGMALAPSCGLSGFYLSGARDMAEIGLIDWFRWWSNTSAGVIVLAPALVAFSPRSLARLVEHWRAGGAWMAALAICCALILLLPSGGHSRPLIAVFGALLIVVGTIHFGLVAASSAAFALLALTAYSVAFNHGAFGGIDELHGLVTLWSLSALFTGLTLIITSLLAERDSAGLERLRAEQRYAQVFEGSPQPTWVYDAASLRFLMVNEAALRQYGWSRNELLSMSVAALAAPGEATTPGEKSLVSLMPLGRFSEPLEARHLTRDGRILDVEVWTRTIDFGGQPAELVFSIDVTERRAMNNTVIEAVAGEQRRIGQEMHDGLGQELTGLALTARALANRASRERDAIAGDLDQLALLATSCIQDARLIVQGLSPLTDSDGNLEAALEALAARSSLSGTPVRFGVQREAPLAIDLKVRNHLYRIAQEAVQNALKHSGARSIDIDLLVRDGSVRLEVQDDGRGLSALDARGVGLGMRTMRFRSSAIGGRLALTPRPGGGNSVVCELPQERAWPPIQRLAT